MIVPAVVGPTRAPTLDYNHDTNSLIMALLALAAVACYAVVLFLLAE